MSIHKKLILLLTLFLSVINLNTQKAYAYDSMLEFESDATSSSFLGYMGSLNDCFSTGKIVLNPLEFNNTYIPTVLSKDNYAGQHQGGVGTGSLASSVGRSAFYLSSLAATAGATAVYTAIALGIEYTIMVDVCTNTYVVQPHEYVNLDKNWIDCVKQDGKYINKHPKALTQMDVPFYYSCDPNYDPISEEDVRTSDDPAVRELSGRTWGYMGAASQYCAGNASEYAEKEMVGAIVFHRLNGAERFTSGYKDHERCTEDEGASKEPCTLRAGEQEYVKSVHFYAHYRQNNNGKIQICVVAPYTLLPIRVGCTAVAPPSEANAVEPFLRDMVEGTRCIYFIDSRTDLNSLGLSLKESVGVTSVSSFLESDLHVVSTLVGCIKDMLVKIFISPSNPEESFFLVVQERLKDIVIVTLMFYVMMVGIKIMSSPQLPNRGEFTMYAIKFALVLFFGTAVVGSSGSAMSNAWFEVKSGNEVSGIYPALISVSEMFAGFFMQAHTEGELTNFCYQLYGDSNVLSNRLISGGGDLVNTEGFNGVKLTVWDLMDCKILNYLNYGSCRYSLSGMVGIWAIGAAFLVTGIGFILGVVTFMYCFLLLLIVFKFTHSFLLSLFVITILVLLSPIMICFSLFEPTKSIFQQWLRMLIGYAIYPGLLFAFIALMLTTLDSIYYGNIDSSQAKSGNFKSACKIDRDDEVYSLFCLTIKFLENDDPCTQGSPSQLANKLLEEKNISTGIGALKGFYKDIAGEYLVQLLILGLFVVLFYIFLGGIDEFVAILVGVHGFGESSKGVINLAGLGLQLSNSGLGAVKNAASSLGKGRG